MSLKRNEGINIERGLDKNERAKLLVEYWKQSTLVQQHFNDISMKVRNFAVVVFSGFLTGVGLSVHKGIFINVLGLEVNAAVLFALAGLVVTQLIHFMDTYWYHVFLKSAVSETLNIEKELKKILKVDTLSSAISKGSQNVTAISIFGLIHLPIGYKNYLDNWAFRWVFKEKIVDSTVRHKIFYRWLIFIIFFTGCVSLFIGPQSPTEQQVFEKYPLEKHYVVSGDNVRLRKAPVEDSHISALLPVGQVILIIKDTGSTWLEVETQLDSSIVRGFIHRDFVTNVKNGSYTYLQNSK